MKSKLLVLLLLAFMLVGCGGNDSKPSDGGKEGDGQQEPSGGNTDPEGGDTDPEGGDTDPEDEGGFPNKAIDDFFTSLGLSNIKVPAFEGEEFESGNFGQVLLVSTEFTTKTKADEVLASYNAALEADPDWTFKGFDKKLDEYIATHAKYSAVQLAYCINMRGDKDEVLGYTLDLFITIEMPEYVVTDSFPTNEIIAFLKYNRLPTYELPSYEADSYKVYLIDEKDGSYVDYGIGISSKFADEAAAKAVCASYFPLLKEAGWEPDEFLLNEYGWVFASVYYESINFAMTTDKNGELKLELKLTADGLDEEFPLEVMINYCLMMDYEVEDIPAFDADMFRFQEMSNFEGDYGFLIGYFDGTNEEKAAKCLAAETALIDGFKTLGYKVDDPEEGSGEYSAYLEPNALLFSFGTVNGRIYFYIHDARTPFFVGEETFASAEAGASSTISFADTESLVTYQLDHAIWNNDAFSLEVAIGASEKDIGGDADKPKLADPLRIMPDQIVTIRSSVLIKEIVFECDKSILTNYAKNLFNSDFGVNVTKELDKPMVKLTLTEPATELSFVLAKQTRLNNVTVKFAE